MFHTIKFNKRLMRQDISSLKIEHIIFSKLLTLNLTQLKKKTMVYFEKIQHLSYRNSLGLKKLYQDCKFIKNLQVSLRNNFQGRKCFEKKCNIFFNHDHTKKK